VSAVDGCFVKSIEANAAVLELKVHAADAAKKDDLRSTLLARLAERFSREGAGSAAATGDLPTFS
jgi:hypothetical protein